jgi:hypothetical protein
VEKTSPSGHDALTASPFSMPPPSPSDGVFTYACMRSFSLIDEIRPSRRQIAPAVFRTWILHFPTDKKRRVATIHESTLPITYHHSKGWKESFLPADVYKLQALLYRKQLTGCLCAEAVPGKLFTSVLPPRPAAAAAASVEWWGRTLRCPGVHLHKKYGSVRRPERSSQVGISDNSDLPLKTCLYPPSHHTCLL